MARTAEQIIQSVLGGNQIKIATLQAELEAAQEEIERLRAEEKAKSRDVEAKPDA